MKVIHSLLNYIEKYFVYIALFVFVVYFLPYFYFGQDANILIHDNLDSNIAWIKAMLDHDALFSSPQVNIPSIFNGLPASSVYPLYDIPSLIFKIFGLYWGYVVNKILMALIGFTGMYFLLKKHFLSQQTTSVILIGSSLLFSLLPFWSFTASVCGLPFVLYAFLNFRINKSSVYDWVILFLFAFYSSLFLSGLFLLIILSTVFLYDIIRQKKINWMFFFGMLFLTILYLISHYPVIEGFLYGAKSHRIEFIKASTDLPISLKKSWDIFYKGQYHAHSFHSFLLVPIVFLLIFSKTSVKVKLILVFIIMTSFFYGISNYHFIKPVIDQITKIVPIQLQRFHFLHPMFWYVLFAISLAFIVKRFKIGKFLVLFVLLIQLKVVFTHHELYENRNKLTFNEFYSRNTFSEIKELIGSPIDSYRVISVGLHPSISQVNGFYTLDGYIPNYPLTYKHQFRKVIADEIERDKKLASYFDNWGSRCYAFSSENTSFLDNSAAPIDSLNFNYSMLHSMGCEYVFSASSINEEINDKLSLIGLVETDDYWSIYVYKISDEN